MRIGYEYRSYRHSIAAGVTDITAVPAASPTMKLQIYAVLLLAVLPAALEGKRLKSERKAAKLRAQKEAARAADAAPAFCPGPPGAFKGP